VNIKVSKSELPLRDFVPCSQCFSRVYQGATMELCDNILNLNCNYLTVIYFSCHLPSR